MPLGNDTEEIHAEVVDIVRALTGRGDELDDQASLMELGIDSLGLVELALALEARWSVRLEAEDYDGLSTIADAVAIIKKEVE